jgi:hypothetical protein
MAGTKPGYDGGKGVRLKRNFSFTFNLFLPVQSRAKK